MKLDFLCFDNFESIIPNVDTMRALDKLSEEVPDPSFILKEESKTINCIFLYHKPVVQMQVTVGFKVIRIMQV